MTITYRKDNAAPKTISGAHALVFWRAYRSELWAQGERRDPLIGDCVLGVKIVALAI